MNKTSTVILLLVVIAIGVFVYRKNIPVTPATTINNQTATTTTIENTNNQPSSLYNQLSETDKNFIDRYAEKYKDIYQPILESLNNNEVYAKSTILVKYSDAKTVALAVLNGKAGLDLNIYDVITLNQLNKNHVTLFGNFIETKNYIVVVYDTSILYYKKGSTDMVTISKSELDPKTETYIKLGGFGSTYDFTFDEATKTITASVFKSENKEGKENPKIRTVTLALP